MSRWRKSGHDRLYVNLPDGAAVAWADCRTGKVTVLAEEHRPEALALLRRHLADLPQPPHAQPAPPTHAQPPQPPHAQPATHPEADRHRPGPDVPAPAPPRPAPLVPAAPTPALPHPGRPGPRAHRGGTGPRNLPPLRAPDDLARNRPGSGIQEMLRSKGPSRFRRTLDRLLRRETEWDSWFKGLAGERIAGAELERLRAQGWKVLHSIPLTRGGDIDHLLVGPGGVFTVNTKNFRGKSIWVGDDMVKVDHGPPHPYPARSRAEAALARGVLERHCPFPVEVEPVLVFVGAREIPRAATQLRVRVYREREVASLGPLTGRLAPEQVDIVYAVARHRRAWLAP
ncbi:nuclease-related domain-containing protein [Streptomyces sp. Isolate_45]|uniref:nuclease-related domain-containing protein n=1 Tax=Streptomyces sp. Isolate_45 TaxID=2950111 RepID=UPI002481EC25|nr:nuclease-related domain-containing protein [Streptomyces sp. Isolate_45]MDA5282682.1 nuclease-related domain-containing protein [Streptomyces sp. Isolate_45]